MGRLISLLLAVVIYTASGTVKFAWDNPNPPEVVIDHYELSMFREDAKGNVVDEHHYGTANTQISIPKPHSGTWHVTVKACKPLNPDGTAGPCSEPASSLDPINARLMDGTPGAWKVRWKPTAPIIMTVE